MEDQPPQSEQQTSNPQPKQPKLRFTQDSGESYPEWEEKQVKDVGEINPQSDKFPEEFFYVDLSSVKEGRLLFDDVSAVKKENAPSRAQRVLKENDILFQTVRPYQQNNYFFKGCGPRLHEYVASTGYAVVRTVKHNPLFIYYALHNKTLLNKVLENSFGSNYPSINSTAFSLLPISLPSLPEQEKVANLLSLVDEKIVNLECQHETWKQYKKALLQQLFP